MRYFFKDAKHHLQWKEDDNSKKIEEVVNGGTCKGTLKLDFASHMTQTNQRIGYRGAYIRAHYHRNRGFDR